MNTAEFLYRHFDIGPADRCLALMTLECDLSVLDVFATLATGGAIVVVDEEHRRDPDHWARQIHQHGVTVLNFLPGSMEMLVEVGDGRLSSVRVVLTGGDWVRPRWCAGCAHRRQGYGSPASAGPPRRRSTPPSTRPPSYQSAGPRCPTACPSPTTLPAW